MISLVIFFIQLGDGEDGQVDGNEERQLTAR